MRETTNYNLKKPDENEFFDLENHFNHNADIIDTVLKESKDIADSKAPKSHTHNASDIEGLSMNAKDINYDNKTSGLTSTKAQGAIDEIHDKAKSALSKANANETSILTLGNQDGDLSKLKTTDKTSLTNAINEVFQNANNGKNIVATAIGTPLSSNDTFSVMGSKIDTLTQTFKNNLTAKGVNTSNADKISTLIDKVTTIKVEEHDFPSWANFNNDYWVKGASDISRECVLACSAVVGKKIHVIGGSYRFNSHNCYDTVSNTWTTKASYPESLGTSNATATLHNNTIYVIGGSYAQNGRGNFAYDTVSNTWTEKLSHKFEKSDHSATLIGDLIYCIGGWDSSASRPFDSNDVYSISSNTWSTRTKPNSDFACHTATLYGNSIYILGGIGRSAIPRKDILVYNTNTGWTYEKDTLFEKVTNACAELVGNTIYYIGGYTGRVSDEDLRDCCYVQTYNITTKTIEIKSSIPTPRYSFVTGNIDGKIYCIGGRSSSVLIGNILSIKKTEIYIP